MPTENKRLSLGQQARLNVTLHRINRQLDVIEDILDPETSQLLRGFIGVVGRHPQFLKELKDLEEKDQQEAAIPSSVQ